MTDEQFYQLCQANPDIKIERDAEGKIIVMVGKTISAYTDEKTAKGVAAPPQPLA